MIGASRIIAILAIVLIALAFGAAWSPWWFLLLLLVVLVFV